MQDLFSQEELETRNSGVGSPRISTFQIAECRESISKCVLQNLEIFSVQNIEHAARNTAAAPLWRRSSWEWPCKIRILLLSIGRLCCIFGVSWGLLVIILGALRVHVWAKLVHFGSLGGTWHPEKASPEKELKNGRCISRGWGSFRDHVGFIFNKLVKDFWGIVQDGRHTFQPRHGDWDACRHSKKKVTNLYQRVCRFVNLENYLYSSTLLRSFHHHLRLFLKKKETKSKKK